NVIFEDNVDNSSTSYTAANILEMLLEDNNEDNDNNDNRQHNYIYILDDDIYSNSSTAISSNEYDREIQSEKSKGKLREYEASQIPAEFDRMNNILEICNWLVKHPSILQLANQMHMASSSSMENIGTFNESSMPSSAISSKINNNKDSTHIWDEEIKCLFLRTRFPPAH
ncbi:24710_t:CDS:2, partial [Dentiscutata erythropus]